MKYFSPAKLNLFLKLHGKRSNGFHEMTTRYQTIDFGDELSLENSVKDSLVCNIPELHAPQNLIWKSLKLFREHTRIHDPVSWNLHKRIPIGSGIGGGSSNAATALHALNVHFQTKLSDETLREIGKKIGMDVPLFFSSGSVVGVGCGEEILPYEDASPQENYVLYFSDKGVMTKDAFAHVLPEDFAKKETDVTLYKKENDLEKPVFRFRKDLLEKKHMLERIWSPFQGHVRMSGSGATLFVSYPREIEKEPSTATAIYKAIENSCGMLVNAVYKKDAWYLQPDSLFAGAGK
ncbi:4-(cytidine 5'-diphospho)-2-C-methyl-D-erythritol kinase [Chlamydia vaughanii]|uniref:4-(cytidine 5'-diphospho)-2-C-methyl-D-erythritol kinase n=1 Tax=Chlamydia vaughanii TaxID=3112552 RepID=UPI0032B2FF2D